MIVTLYVLYVADDMANAVTSGLKVVTGMKEIPSCQNKWIEYYSFQLSGLKFIYYTQNMYLIIFQEKRVHTIFNNNDKLYLWKIKEPSPCKIDQHINDLGHYFI